MWRPTHPVLGPSTLNIGVIQGGPAANIISDHASASVVIRVVDDLEELKRIALGALDERVTATVTTETPAVHMEPIEGFETSIVKYTTDIPKLTNWGNRFYWARGPSTWPTLSTSACRRKRSPTRSASTRGWSNNSIDDEDDELTRAFVLD
ncbi:MAG: peptidase dimerization domain-containing protein [Bryobacterales bacterium]